MFIASPAQFTLPRQMYAGLREFLSPTIAAAAVLLILCSLLLLGAERVRSAPARKARSLPLGGSGGAQLTARRRRRHASPA